MSGFVVEKVYQISTIPSLCVVNLESEMLLHNIGI